MLRLLDIPKEASSTSVQYRVPHPRPCRCSCGDFDRGKGKGQHDTVMRWSTEGGKSWYNARPIIMSLAGCGMMKGGADNDPERPQLLGVERCRR